MWFLTFDSLGVMLRLERGESFVVERFWESRAGLNERGGGDTLGAPSQSHVLEWGRGSSTTSLGWWLTPAIGSGREQQGVGAAPLWENCVIHLVHNCVQSFWSELYSVHSVSCVHLLRSEVHCNRCDWQPCVKLLSSEVYFVHCVHCNCVKLLWCKVFFVHFVQCTQ